MDDLWGYGDAEAVPDHFSDSSDDRVGHKSKDSDCEEIDLLPENKRRKLKQLGYRTGRQARAGENGAADHRSRRGKAGEDVVVLDSDEDSDRRILREAQAQRAAGQHTPSSAAAAPAARQKRAQGGAAAARPVDSRSAAMLQQALELRKKLKAAQQEPDDLSDSEPLEPSPVVLRGTAAAAAAEAGLRHRQGNGTTDDGFDLTRGSTPDSQAATAAGGDAAGAGYDLPPAAAAAGGPSDDTDRIMLKLNSAKAGEKVLRMRLTDPFAKLFAAYKAWAAAEGHLPSADAPGVRFVFDGDPLSPNETPAGLDLEGGECVDVYL